MRMVKAILIGMAFTVACLTAMVLWTFAVPLSIMALGTLLAYAALAEAGDEEEEGED